MSIICRDIDTEIFKYLNISDKKNMSKINKYYNNFVKKQIGNIYDFYKIIDTIKFDYTQYTGTHLTFFKSCIFGKIDVCEYLLNTGKYNINIDNEFAFRLICEHHVDMIPWILPQVKHIYAHIKHHGVLYSSSLNYDFNAMKNILNIVDIAAINSDEMHTIFLNKNMSLDKIKYFCEHISVSLFMNHHIFDIICARNDMDILQYVYKKFPCVVSVEAFENACLKNNVEVFKWLLSIRNDFDITVNNNYLYKKTCYYGNIEFFQLLLNIYDPFSSSFYEDCFKNAIDGNKPEMVKFLYSIKPDINIHKGDGMYLHSAIQNNNNYETIRVLFELNSVNNFDADSRRYLLKNVYRDNDLNLIETLINSKSVNINAFINYAIKDKNKMEHILKNIKLFDITKTKILKNLIDKSYELFNYFLLILGKIDITKIKHKKIVALCKHDINLALLLPKYDNRLSFIIENNKIIRYAISHNIED